MNQIIDMTDILLYKRNTNISGNIFNHNLRTSMNEGLVFLWFVIDQWRQWQTAILTQILLLMITRWVIFKNLLSTSSASWLELLNRGSLRVTALSLQAGFHSAFLCPTNSTAAGTSLYPFITPACFRFFFRLFTQVNLWLIARSRVNIHNTRIANHEFLTNQN